MTDQEGMQYALIQAQKAFQMKEVPVGAVIVREDKILAKACNQMETLHSSTGHAEILAIQEASQKLMNWRLTGCSLYVTLEPCLMCAGAILQARFARVVIGALDPKAGAVVSLYQVLKDARLNHQSEVIIGVLQDECSHILKSFFQNVVRKTHHPS